LRFQINDNFRTTGISRFDLFADRFCNIQVTFGLLALGVGEAVSSQ
jgi:hypothetical protein